MLPEPTKWESLQKIMDVVSSNKWTWAFNTRCKYITLKVDMRDGHCVMQDRDGNPLTLAELQWQVQDDKNQ